MPRKTQSYNRFAPQFLLKHHEKTSFLSPNDVAAAKEAVPEEQWGFSCWFPTPSLSTPALRAPSPGNGHGLEVGVPLGDGFLDGTALGTHTQAVAGVLHVAPCRDSPSISHPKPHQLLSSQGIDKEKPFSLLPLFIFPSAVIFGSVRDGACQEAAGEDTQPQHPGMTPLHPHK